MKKILVPIDFSLHSEYALKVAAIIAKQMNSEIIVLHMLGLSEAILTKDEAQEAAEAIYYIKLAEKRFTTFLDKDYLTGIRVTKAVQNYKIFSEINEVAKEKKADLIVMGSHGSSGLSEVFVGSNTEKVVRTAEVPVLVIKKPMKEFRIKEVVFACDFKIENLKPYHKALQLLELFNPNIHLLYVNLPAENFRSSDQIEETIKEFLFRADAGNLDRYNDVIIQNDYSVESGIFSYSKKINADMIIIPTHGRKGLSHFFNGSIGEDIINHTNIPVITLKI
ncbi:universal stress protein [Aquimarina pacifica]|uniref:universal stress protein n=1 Tax=Aquimarina pacifica TaxID=1296415 RepID=UPI00046F7C10|nr:universal stress protein [Aquimarina pacifica]